MRGVSGTPITPKNSAKKQKEISKKVLTYQKRSDIIQIKSEQHKKERERKERIKKEGNEMKVGYIRVSTEEQNTARQENLMRELGVEKVYIEKCTGKNANRPKLMELMGFVREGDVVVVSEISRFARNTKDLLTLVEQLTEKGVQFESQKEKIDTNTPAGKFMLTVFAAISQLEREYILSRQREGIEAKKAMGGYKGRIPISVDKSQFEQEYRLWKDGHITAVTAMAHLGLKPNTFYRRVRQYEDKN